MGRRPQHGGKLADFPSGCNQSAWPGQGSLAVTTLNAATGLEAPVVMLLGMDRLLETEGDPRLSEDERNDLRRDHTRLLYMGFTRAGQRLIVLRRAAAI